MPTQYATYPDYWEAYLKAHSRPITRACHYLATVVGVSGGVTSLITLDWRFVGGGILAGYVIAVGSHFVFEKNRPLVNRPLWGARSDLRMCALALTSKLQAELGRTPPSEDTLPEQSPSPKADSGRR